MEAHLQLLTAIFLASFVGYEVFAAANRDKSASGGVGFGAVTGVSLLAALVALGAPAGGLKFPLGFLAVMLGSAAAVGGLLTSRRVTRTDRY